MIRQEFNSIPITLSEETSRADITGLFQNEQPIDCIVQKFWMVAQQTVPLFFELIKTPFIIPSHIEMAFGIMDLYAGRDKLPTLTCPKCLDGLCTALYRSISYLMTGYASILSGDEYIGVTYLKLAQTEYESAYTARTSIVI